MLRIDTGDERPLDLVKEGYFHYKSYKIYMYYTSNERDYHSLSIDVSNLRVHMEVENGIY